MTADQQPAHNRGQAIASRGDHSGLPAALIRPMAAADWPDVRRIYAAGIATGNATFESQPPDWDRFDTDRLTAGRLVAIDESQTVIGWVALSPTSSRPVYRGVVEHSVYIDERARGRGVGRRLLTAMIEAADNAGIWTIQSSIFAENTASLTLHATLGFRTVGRRERIAEMSHGPWAGQWRDTILIERRSSRDPDSKTRRHADPPAR